MPNTREKLIELLFEGACLNTEHVEKWILGGKQGEKPNAFQSQADHLIANDVVPVVRCKDCKHLEITGCYGECGKLVRIVKPWDFCSYGERKDNG